MSKRKPHPVFFASIVFALLPLSMATAIAEKGTAEQYEKDLELVATLTSPAKFECGLKPEFKLQVANRSKTGTHRIIKPGDGSEVGWRSPHVYATAERLNEKNEWVSFKSVVDYGRCGNYDTTLVPLDLKPDEKFEIKDWIPSTCINHEFNKAGKYRVRWHYDVDLDKTSQPTLREDDAPENVKLSNVPNFSLVSKWVELEVRQRLMLELKVKAEGDQITTRPSKTNGYQILDLASMFSVNLKNVSDEARELTVPTINGDARLMFQWYEVKEKREFVSMLQYSKEANEKGEKFELQPNEIVELTGDGTGGNRFGGDWETSSTGKIRVRAMYWLSTWKTPFSRNLLGVG